MRRAALAAVTGIAIVAATTGFVAARTVQDDARAARPESPRVRNPEVRLRARTAASHSADISVSGGTAQLFASDTLRAYAMGRELFTREFTPAEGLFGKPIGRPLLEDGRTPVVPGSRAASCLLCHNAPLHDAGAGPTIEKNGATGRNTPHLFGGGLVEMIGWEIRRRLLAIGDADGDGFIGTAESAGARALLRGVAGDEGFVLDLGAFGDRDGDGDPDLNEVCRVTYVDADGRRIAGADRLDAPDVAGYDVEVQVFGWGHTRASRAPLSSTLRGFSAAAFNVHAGLQANDPTLNACGDGRDPVSVSLAGAPQFKSGATPDRGLVRSPRGASLDDPDADGVADELTEGDLDVLEFYLLHHPAPAERLRLPAAEAGRTLFASMGCVRCHVPDWRLPASGPDDAPVARRATGDRRLFAVDVSADPRTGELRGAFERLSRDGGRPRGAALVVRGVYSDFLHHNLGPRFHQTQFDGSVARTFRTPPLWGVGSTAPYGHDGASLDLASVILRHGGEAEGEAAAFASAPAANRDAVLEFLRGLVLYSVDELSCDMNGDGCAEERFRPDLPASPR